MKLSWLLATITGFSWTSLWYTPDQAGQQRLQQGDFQAAAETFRDPMRQGVAWFRGGEFAKAEQAFAHVAIPEAEFNRGNCLVMLGQYEAAVARYDRALELRADWDDARINRDIAVARARLVERKGADMGDQKLGADDITFEKGHKSGGQDTQVEAPALSGAEMQALWLRRVQTKPADFLRAKFAHQLATGKTGEDHP
ncbi:tetratricopeptide repeat protein [Methyloparacoccus murrellii]